MARAQNNYYYRLRKYRCRMGFTPKQVAKRLGHKDTSLISRWETGTANLSLENAVRLSKLYKTLINELVYELDREIGQELFPEEIDTKHRGHDP
jgi:transcriptional regulator with XRE-family HTH domain